MLHAGLIGLGSCGKSTLFQLMTRRLDTRRSGHGKADANIGLARVPDDRLDLLAAMYQPRKVTHANVEVADMVVAPRSGARDLLEVAPFRNATALLHVVRTFRDDTIPHPAGTIDPARDAQAMEDELILADLLVVERRLERLDKDLKKSPSPDLKQERELLQSCRTALEGGRPIRTLSLSATAAKRLRGFQFLSAKPLLLVLNLDEAELPDIGRAVEVTRMGDFLVRSGTRSVPVCAKIELEIAALPEDDRRTFMADLGLKESGLDRVIRASYDLLGYISFFTVGEDECRAWSVPRETAAQEAAGEIHRDLERGFIRAEVVPYKHLARRGSLAAAREHGELRLEGKDYVVQDGDVIHFRFAT